MIETKLSKVLDELKKAQADGKFDLREILHTTIAVLDFFVDLDKCFRDEERFDELIKVAVDWYETVIEPIDIKRVPNWLEPYVDKVVAEQIPGLLMLARLQYLGASA